jgi:hypothetical protein
MKLTDTRSAQAPVTALYPTDAIAPEPRRPKARSPLPTWGAAYAGQGWGAGAKAGAR